MKRSILAVAALSLAIPFAASARPAASFNDHVEHYTTSVAAPGMSGGKAAVVLPSFIDAAELLSQAAPEARVVAERMVLAGGGFNYPRY
jgi:hypothetical protein